MKSMEFSTIWQWWKNLIIMAAIFLPKQLAKLLEEKEGGERYPMVIKALPIIILALSVASIATIHTRVELHHGGWNSPLVAFGTAALVPAAAIAANFIRYRFWSGIFWGVTFAMAAISGSIQYGVYAIPNPTIMQMVESIAFGFGIPTAEVLLAIMEMVMIKQHAEDVEARQARSKAEDEAEQARQRAEAEAEEARQRAAAAHTLHLQQLAQEAEDARKHASELRQIELEKARLDLAEGAKDREAKRQERLFKAERAPVQQPARTPVPEQDTPAQGSLSDRDLALRMLPVYHEDPEASDGKLAAMLDVSRTRILRVRNWLSEQEVIHVESKGQGKGNIVTVNGNEKAFVANEL